MWPGGSVQRGRQFQRLRLAVRGLPVVDPAGKVRGDKNEDFELLGLSGNIELALDAETRTPLLLSGNAPVFGKVTLRLSEVHLN